MMTNSGLSTKPWCTPNFTSNSSLNPLQIRTQLRTFSYIPASFTIHSFLQHQAFSMQISLLSKELGRTSLGPRKPNQSAYREKFLLQLVYDNDCICFVSASAWEEPKLLFVNSHHLSDEAVGNSLNDFHSLLRHFLSSIVASAQSLSPFPLQTQTIKLCSQAAGTFPSRMNDEVTDHGSTCINCCSVHLHHYP